MALIIPNKKFNNGLELENVYVKIDKIEGDKNNIDFIVKYYANKDARFNNKLALSKEYYNFTPSMDNVNIFIQAYLHLKTLENFKGAIDILE